MSIVSQLRKAGLSVEKDYQGKKIKAQFKTADRLQAKYVVVLGDEELNRDVVNVKEMSSGEQNEVAIDSLVSHITDKLSRGEM